MKLHVDAALHVKKQGQAVHESEVIDRGDRLMTSRKTHTLTEERLKMSDTPSYYD